MGTPDSSGNWGPGGGSPKNKTSFNSEEPDSGDFRFFWGIPAYSQEAAEGALHMLGITMNALNNSSIGSNIVGNLVSTGITGGLGYGSGTLAYGAGTNSRDMEKHKRKKLAEAEMLMEQYPGLDLKAALTQVLTGKATLDILESIPEENEGNENEGEGGNDF